MYPHHLFPKLFNPLLALILKLSNLTNLKKININMNLSIKSLTFCLLYFTFYQKKAFQKVRKTVFISSNKYFSFLRCSMFYFSFSFQLPDSKGQTKKRIFVSMFCNSKIQVTSSRPFLFFIILSIKRHWVQRKKIILPFPCLF